MKTSFAEPEIITRKGQARLRDPADQAYQEMLERLEDAEDVAWLRKMRKKPLQYRPLSEYLADRKARV